MNWKKNFSYKINIDWTGSVCVVKDSMSCRPRLCGCCLFSYNAGLFRKTVGPFGPSLGQMAQTFFPLFFSLFDSCCPVRPQMTSRSVSKCLSDGWPRADLRPEGVSHMGQLRNYLSLSLLYSYRWVIYWPWLDWGRWWKGGLKWRGK